MQFLLSSPPSFPVGARTRTNNKLNSHLTPSPGIEPGSHWWEACMGGKCSTTTPSLLLLSRQFVICHSFHFIKIYLVFNGLFCLFLQVNVLQKDTSLHKCKSVTDPHYRMLDKQNVYGRISLN